MASAGHAPVGYAGSAEVPRVHTLGYRKAALPGWRRGYERHGRISHEPPPRRSSPDPAQPRPDGAVRERRDAARSREPGRLRAAPVAGAVLPPQRPGGGRGLEPGGGGRLRGEQRHRSGGGPRGPGARPRELLPSAGADAAGGPGWTEAGASRRAADAGRSGAVPDPDLAPLRGALRQPGEDLLRGADRRPRAARLRHARSGGGPRRPARAAGAAAGPGAERAAAGRLRPARAAGRPSGRQAGVSRQPAGPGRAVAEL